MPPFCYLNGKIIPVADARVGVYDIGLLRGFGIYEGLVSYNRKPFMLADHLARFHNSAERMALKIPVSDADIETAVNELIARNTPEGKEALIRAILTGGEAIGGIEYNYGTPTFYILVEEFVPIDKNYLKNGCRVIVFEHYRQIAESKTTNYTQTVLLQKARKEAGALEVLFASDGKVLEGGGSNIFVVKNGKIITPEKGILPGVTRKVVIDLARKEFSIEERAVTTEEMYSADEMFITGSFKEIVPVVQAGDRTIGNGKVGEVTKRVMRLFHEFTRNY
ncbi:MAG TPA: aminotransferase class IV [Candidatus Paceibacterota bacterium]|nr:aminotransferase class IV [Candidatus Paceibacterota bacterium]